MLITEALAEGCVIVRDNRINNILYFYCVSFSSNIFYFLNLYSELWP